MFITVITVCLNAVENIEKTIQSIICQDYPEIEYIVVDGGSNDGTLDIVKQYRDKVSLLISEPDEGLYDAMNKGIMKSGGKIINFMNAGDCFASDDVLSSIANSFTENPDKVIIYGDVIIDDSEKTIKEHPDILTKCIIMNFWLNQQSIFYRRSAFEIVGLFQKKYRIYADYEWNLRAFITHNLSFLHTSKIICLYEGGGISGISSDPSGRHERRAVRKKYFSFLERIFYSLHFKIKNRLITRNYTMPLRIKNIFKC
jgi:glycosyltransferase involved in cell wall biosynthesis